jgi:hypothetical protein
MFRLLVLSIFIAFGSAVVSARMFDGTRITPARSLWRRAVSPVSYVPNHPADSPDEPPARAVGALGDISARDGIPGVTSPNFEADVPQSLLPNPPRARFIKGADYADIGTGTTPPSQITPAVANAQPQSTPS